MPSVNRIILLGEVIEVPQVRETDNGSVVARFSISVGRVTRPGMPSKADDIPVVAWGDVAAQAQQLTQKGALIFIEGRISVRSFDASDGQRKWVTEVEARQIRQFELTSSSQVLSEDPIAAPSYHLDEKANTVSEFDFNESSQTSAPFGQDVSQEVPF